MVLGVFGGFASRGFAGFVAAFAAIPLLVGVGTEDCPVIWWFFCCLVCERVANETREVRRWCEEFWWFGAFSSCGFWAVGLDTAPPNDGSVVRDGDEVWRRAKEMARCWIFCLRCSLTLIETEEICGRFGRFDDWMLAYRPTSFGDDVGYSFTVLRLLLFRQLKHRTEDVRDREIVLDVQGSTSRIAQRCAFNLRV
jgi:hypothetical protein